MNRAWLKYFVLIAGASLLIACSQGEATSTTAPPSVTPTTTATAAPTSIPATPTTVPSPTARPTRRPTATPVPQPTPLPDTLLQPAGADLNLPEGFVGEVWLDDVTLPTAFAFDDQDRLYIATEGGDLLRVNYAADGEPPTDWGKDPQGVSAG